VAVEDVAITVTRGGYLKRTSVDTYRRQTRGGKGRIGMGTRAEDFVERLIVASTHSYLLIFTTRGRVYWLKAYEIPDATTTGKGKHIQPHQPAARRDRQGVPRSRISCRPVHRDGDQARRHQEDRADRVRQPHVARHHRGVAGRRRRADRRQDHHGDNYIFLGSHQGQAIRFRERGARPWAARRAACAPCTWPRATT
jgi:DNA gyrase subunit A